MPNYKKYSDNELASIICNNKRKREKAFTELYFRYENMLYNHLRFICSSNEVAEDIFQQSWHNFYTAILKGKTMTNAKAYIFTIANNLYRNHLRNHKSTIAIDDDQNEALLNDINLTVSSDDKMDQDEIQKIVSVSIDLLDENSREIIIMKKFDGMTYKEIGEIFSITKDGAKKRFEQAMIKLHKILKPYLEDLYY